MPDSNTDKLVLELVACNRCKNAFMMQKGEKLRKQEQNEEKNHNCDNYTSCNFRFILRGYLQRKKQGNEIQVW